MMLWCVQVGQFVQGVKNKQAAAGMAFEPDTRSMYLLGQALTAAEYLDAHTVAWGCTMAMGHF